VKDINPRFTWKQYLTIYGQRFSRISVYQYVLYRITTEPLKR